MSVEDAMHAGRPVSRADAIAEASKHDYEEVDLINELGDHDTYSARALLEWLGY